LDGGGTVEFGFSYDESDQRSSFYFLRVSALRPLFAALVEAYPTLTGECRVWLDDKPSAPGGLAFSGPRTDHVLIPDAHFLCAAGYAVLGNWVAPPWPERRGQVFWRGAPVGKLGSAWRSMPRVAMCLDVADFRRPDLFDVKIAEIVGSQFSQTLIEEIRASGVVGESCPPPHFMHYKYNIDIDGVSCSWSGLFTKLRAKNVVLKIISDNDQWYYDRLIAWHNFIPVIAVSDLLDIALWLHEHDEEAERIAERGCELAASLTFDRVIDEAVPRIREHILNEACH
jgi:hypothetical protein